MAKVRPRVPVKRARRSGAAVRRRDPVTATRYDVGRRVRAEVLGAAHVARAEARKSALDADFQRFITEMAWGSVWSRPGLDRRTRSLITIAILAALGRREELALHLRASRNVGVEPAGIAEMLLHVAVYAGVPAANTAFAVAKSELETPVPPSGSRRRPGRRVLR